MPRIPAHVFSPAAGSSDLSQHRTESMARWSRQNVPVRRTSAGVRLPGEMNRLWHWCSPMLDPLHSFHWFLWRWCSQMIDPLHSLHVLLWRWCSQMLDPLHSLHRLLIRWCFGLWNSYLDEVACRAVVCSASVRSTGPNLHSVRFEFSVPNWSRLVFTTGKT